MNNAELIAALRYCAKTCNPIGKCECPFVRYGHKCIDTMLLNAADALEAQMPKQDRGVCMTACGTLYVPNYDD